MSVNDSIITPFCEFLEEDHSQNPSPLIGLFKKLKKVFHKTKADFNLNFSSYSHHVDDEYLDYFINELHSCYQIHDTESKDIQEWLDEHSTKIDDIDKLKYPKELKVFFELPFDQGSTSSDLDETLIIRSNLIKYFKNKYAQEMIDFLESRKTNRKQNKTLIEDKDYNSVDNFESKDVLSQLLHLLSEIDEIPFKIYNENQGYAIHGEEDEALAKYQEEESILKNQIPPLLDKLYEYSRKNNYYYFDCSSEVYKNHFEEKFNRYRKEVPEGDELDFLKAEFKYLSEPSDNRLLDNHYNYNSYIDYKERYRISYKRKLEFLSTKLEAYNFKIAYNEDADLASPYIDYNYESQISLKKVKSNSSKKYIDLEIQIPQDNLQRLKWIGKKTHIGLIIGQLVEYGYIEAPKKKNEDVNYSLLARQVKQVFDCEVSESTLAKYLNETNEKHLEVLRAFKKRGYNLPNSKEFN